MRNCLRLVCDGDRVQVWFNGRLVNSGFGAKPTRGRLQLQNEGCAACSLLLAVFPYGVIY